jgi:hypothetical protein
MHNRRNNNTRGYKDVTQEIDPKTDELNKRQCSPCPGQEDI